MITCTFNIKIPRLKQCPLMEFYFLAVNNLPVKIIYENKEDTK